jgi:N-formylglutamate amidohydrolase
MAEVCDFLELPHLTGLPRVMRNRNKPHEPYDPEALARLRAFYQPYNEQLAEYLGIELDWGRGPGT